MTLDRPDLSRKLVLAPRPRKLPDVLNIEEVAQLLEAAPAPGIKYRVALRVPHTPSRAAGSCLYQFCPKCSDLHS